MVTEIIGNGGEFTVKQCDAAAICPACGAAAKITITRDEIIATPLCECDAFPVLCSPEEAPVDES